MVSRRAAIFRPIVTPWPKLGAVSQLYGALRVADERRRYLDPLAKHNFKQKLPVSQKKLDKVRQQIKATSHLAKRK
jgi:hypothetical protein